MFCYVTMITADQYVCILLEVLADKLSLGQENFLNFALFEIMEDGFGE